MEERERERERERKVFRFLGRGVEAITFHNLKSGGFQVKHLAYAFPSRLSSLYFFIFFQGK